MEKPVSECQHTCGNTCALLTEALQKEKTLLLLYEQIERECDYPPVQAFISELIHTHRQHVAHITQKLDELFVRSTIAESIRESFNL